jgi:hypothetical protein
MLRLMLIVTAVSVALVTLFSGIAMVWSLMMMLMANGFQSPPQSFVVASGAFVSGAEWLCVSAVTAFIARNWFPHVRGGLFLATVIPALVTVAGAAAFWNPFDPVASLTHGTPDSGGFRAATPFVAFAPALIIDSASRGPQSPAERRFSLAVFMVISAALLALGWAALAAVIVALLWALPSRKWRHRDAAIRLAAVQGHRNRAVLRWVATHDKDPAVRQAAQERQAAL